MKGKRQSASAGASESVGAWHASSGDGSWPTPWGNSHGVGAPSRPTPANGILCEQTHTPGERTDIRHAPQQAAQLPRATQHVQTLSASTVTQQAAQSAQAHESATLHSSAQSEPVTRVGARMSVVRAHQQGVTRVAVNTTPTRALTRDECVQRLQPFLLPILPGWVAGKVVERCLIDPGAQMSMIGQDLVARLGLQAQALPPNFKLVAGTWGEETRQVTSVVDVPVTILGRTHQCMLMVMPQMESPVLLGQDALHGLSIVVDCEAKEVTCKTTGDTYHYGAEGRHAKIDQVWVREGETEGAWTLVVERAQLLHRHECPVSLVLRTSKGERCDYTGPIAIAVAKEATDVGVAVKHAVTHAMCGKVAVALPHLGESMNVEPGSCIGLAVPYDSAECITTLMSGKNAIAQLARQRQRSASPAPPRL